MYRTIILIVLILLVCGLMGFTLYREQQKTLQVEWQRDMAVLQRDMLVLRLQRKCRQMDKLDALRQNIKALTDTVGLVNRTLAEIQHEFDTMRKQVSERDVLLSKIKLLEETLAKIKGFFGTTL